MILLADVGNSNILFAISDLSIINKTFRVVTNPNLDSKGYYDLIKKELDNYDITDVIISSVVPNVLISLNDLFKKYYNINSKVLEATTNVGLELKVDEPSTVGVDLICDSVGAMAHSNEAIIVDLGTATKYIYCKDNVFYGCSISPGVFISMKSLVNNTALLPNIELKAPEKVISTNTISCMQSGVLIGAASQVDGMILRIREEFKNDNIPVYATGGLSKLIVPLCKTKMELMPDLTIEGLLEIYKKLAA